MSRSAFFSVVPNATQMLENAGYLGPKAAESGLTDYHCATCDYTTSHLSHWKRHLKTRKHNAGQMLDNAG